MPSLHGLPPGALVLAAAAVPLFLHADYQPQASFGLGATDVTVALADIAVLAVAAAALLEWRSRPRLGASRMIWIAAAAFLAVIAAATLYPLASDRDYPFAAHTVTAAKFSEYALLALSVPLVIRQRSHIRPLFAVLVLLSVAATLVGALQFLGVDIFDAWRAGRRQPSFLGHHDFAALSGATLALALATLVIGESSARVRRVVAAGGLAGALGMVLAGAVTGAAGLILAGAVAAWVGRRFRTLTRARAAALVGIVCAVVIGILALRSANIDQFLRFLGVRPAQRTTTEDVQTFAHRTVLAYIGGRIYLDHPLIGVGWQASADEPAYGPYLDDARREFPDQPDLAFPSPEHPWGVQNAYLQTLADLGILGAAALAALLAAVAVTGVRTAFASRVGSAGLAFALVATLWLAVVMGIWNGIGLIAGLPLDALFWLAVGLAATAAAGMEDARA